MITAIQIWSRHGRATEEEETRSDPHGRGQGRRAGDERGTCDAGKLGDDAPHVREEILPLHAGRAARIPLCLAEFGRQDTACVRAGRVRAGGAGVDAALPTCACADGTHVRAGVAGTGAAAGVV